MRVLAVAGSIGTTGHAIALVALATTGRALGEGGWAITEAGITAGPPCDASIEARAPESFGTAFRIVLPRGPNSWYPQGASIEARGMDQIFEHHFGSARTDPRREEDRRPGHSLTSRGAALVRRRLTQRVLAPYARWVLDGAPDIESVAIVVGQFCAEFSNDEVHWEPLPSVLPTPDFEAAGVARGAPPPDAPVRYLWQPDPVNRPGGKDIDAFHDALPDEPELEAWDSHGEAVSAFAAFCKEVEEHDGSAACFVPYAIFRRARGGVDLEIVGTALRPWLDGVTPAIEEALGEDEVMAPITRPPPEPAPTGGLPMVLEDLHAIEEVLADAVSDPGAPSLSRSTIAVLRRLVAHCEELVQQGPQVASEPAPARISPAPRSSSFGVDPRRLVARLSARATAILEQTVVDALSRQLWEVEPIHMLALVVDDAASAASQLLNALAIDRASVSAELWREVQAARAGNTGRPVLSALVFRWFEDAFLLAFAQRDDARVHTGHLVVSWLRAGHHYTVDRVRTLEDIDARVAERMLEELDEPATGAAPRPSRPSAPRLSLVPRPRRFMTLQRGFGPDVAEPSSEDIDRAFAELMGGEELDGDPFLVLSNEAGDFIQTLREPGEQLRVEYQDGESRGQFVAVAGLSEVRAAFESFLREDSIYRSMFAWQAMSGPE